MGMIILHTSTTDRGSLHEIPLSIGEEPLFKGKGFASVESWCALTERILLPIVDPMDSASNRMNKNTI